MATGLRGATRRASINDKRSERNAQLVKARKRSDQLSKFAVEAMSSVDPVGSALAASDKARSIASTEVDAGVAKPLELKHSFSEDDANQFDAARQVRVYVELYDIESRNSIQTFDYFDYLEPDFENERMVFPSEMPMRRDKIPNFKGYELADESEFEKKGPVTEAGGDEDHEFEANFVISVCKAKPVKRDNVSETKKPTVSSSGHESKTVRRQIKFIDDSGRTVKQLHEEFTFNGIRKGDSVKWSDESHEFGAVTVLDDNGYVIDEPGEKRIVTPESPSEILTEVKVLPKRALDTVSGKVDVSASINVDGAIFKQEPMSVNVEFQKFRSDEHDSFDVYDPEGTIERSIRNVYRNSTFAVEDVQVDVEDMSAIVKLGMPIVSSADVDPKPNSNKPKETSAVDDAPRPAAMSKLASRYGVSFESAHVADDFVDPSESELDALYEAHIAVTKSLADVLNDTREASGLRRVEPRIVDRDDALSIYEWASDACLKRRPSKSRVLNNVIHELGSEYDSELLMNTRAVRAACDENDIANQLMGSVRQAARAGTESALMSENAKYVTAAVLVSSVSQAGDAMSLSASVVMTR